MDKTVKIYQITDTHVSADPLELSAQNYSRLMSFIKSQPADLLVISGDLPGEDGDADIYRWMKAQLPDGQDTVIIPGNHDDDGLLFEVFQDGLNPASDFCHKIALEDIDLVFVNTLSTRLPDNQCRFLEDKTIRPGSILFIHHPTRIVSGGFMDEVYPLGNMDAVHASLCEGNISHVFCGHYHTEAQIDGGEYQLYVTPSPAFKVDPVSVEPKISEPDIPIRIIEVTAGQMQTHVLNLDESPDSQ